MLFIGSDHAGFHLKKQIIDFLTQNNTDFIINDVGYYNEESVDYPIIAHTVCNKVFQSQDGRTFGILICGTGQGMAITANRHMGIRAGIAWNTHIAKMMREHNDANVLCLPARHLTIGGAEEIVSAFLKTPFSGDERHQRRLRLIDL